MKRTHLAAILLFGLVAALGTTLAVLAQEGAPAGDARPGHQLVLHEYFDPDAAFLPSADAALADADAASPGSVIHDGVQIPRPAASDAQPGPSEASYDSDGARDPQTGRALPRQNGPGNANASAGKMRLDDDTDMEGQLNYRTVFNPSVVPFKRGGVMDRVVYRRGRYELEVADRTLRSVPVGPDDGLTRGRDRFWGSLLVEAKPGEVVPIPSVASNARILSVETSPPVAIEFLRDGAENMAVRIGHTGPVRLNFITDASRRYFETDVPAGISLQRPPADLPGAFVGVDAQLEPVAHQIVRAVGVSRDDELHEALPRLVEYFRDFEPVELDDESRVHGDLLLDISLSKRGVCRHRAFGFLLAAQYLNIPTRYVYNEAHAFVEVFVAMRGWTRIDLGGGAEQLSVASDERTVRHDAGSDPFPQPRRYTDNYSRVARDEPSEAMGGFDNVDGLPQLPDEVDDLAPRTASDASRADDGTGNVDRDPDTDPAPDHVDASSLLSAPAGALGSPDHASDPPRTAPTPAPTPRSRPVLTLTGLPDSALRGGELTVEGTLEAADGDVPLEGRVVEIVLAPVGDTPGSVRTLATASTDALGAYRADIRLPQTLPVGRWDLYARFPGDPDWTEARSQ